MLPFVRLVTLRYGHRVYLCAARDPYFKHKEVFMVCRVVRLGYLFYIKKSTIQNTYEQSRLLRHVALLLYVFDVGQLSV